MRLHVYQSTWGMEGLPWRGGEEWDLEERFDRILEAGFEGVSLSLAEPETARLECGLAIERGLRIQGQYFPDSLDGLAPAFELIAELGAEHVDHVCLQPDLRPSAVLEAIPYVLHWQAMAEEVGVPTYLETHRNTISNDLLFTLDLIEAVPSLGLVVDLSHFVVAREFGWPISDEVHDQVRRILDHGRAFHGRVASREQVQLQIDFAQHELWLELFTGWWREGFRIFRESAPEDAILTFTPELGPPGWYAMTGPDGQELSDRWSEALRLAELARGLWAELEAETPFDDGLQIVKSGSYTWQPSS